MTSPTETAPVKRRTRSKTAPDQIGVDAWDMAREALIDVVGAEAVGDHEGATRESDRVVIHSFQARHRGYTGWSWKVMVARASRARAATVCDSWLEPGDGALLAPAWVPWADRLRPGDVSATDRLAYIPDDNRLMQGYEATDDTESDQVALWELGLGRERVLSEAGRTQAATRWSDGERGPQTRAARRADHQCGACGFYLQLAGAMRQTFGVCANEWSAADGHVVAIDYGCGAHSESDVEETPTVVGEPVLDESGYDVIELPEDVNEDTVTGQQVPGQDADMQAAIAEQQDCQPSDTHEEDAEVTDTEQADDESVLRESRELTATAEDGPGSSENGRAHAQATTPIATQAHMPVDSCAGAATDVRAAVKTGTPAKTTTLAEPRENCEINAAANNDTTDLEPTGGFTAVINPEAAHLTNDPQTPDA